MIASTMEGYALHAAQFFRVFPLPPGKKEKPPTDFEEKATQLATRVSRFWYAIPKANVGLAMGRGQIGIDVDSYKGGSLAGLEIEGKFFPPTWRQKTPRGGFHLIYTLPLEVRAPSTVEKLAPGVDTRGEGAYLVGPGSRTEDGKYKLEVERYPVPAPQWLVEWCLARAAKAPSPTPRRDEPLPATVIQWAREFLAGAAPAVQGHGGDAHTFVVACQLRDLGLSEVDSLELLIEDWNTRCSPPWSIDELATKIRNAHTYARDVPGNADPRNDFEPTAKKALDMIEELNREYALVTVGGGVHVLWEAPDRLEHLSVAAWKIRVAPLKGWAEKWLRSPKRREYDGIGFWPQPGPPAPPKQYNLWRGFRTEPKTEVDPRGQKAVEDLLGHVRTSFCAGKAEQFDRLMGFFAHLIQKPGEKPRVAVVFQGEKGVGKSFLIEAIAHLLGKHSLVAASRRYLAGQFNSYYEQNLLAFFEEVCWAGDKEAEGILKDLITGATHNIERKGKEPYEVQNLTRVVIASNEPWVTPATHDERRFDCYHVDNRRKGDTKFFSRIKEGLVQHGGYEYLLAWLLNPALLDGLDLNKPLLTNALLVQKHQSLQPFEQWWYSSLEEGRLLNHEAEEWPVQIEKEEMRQAFRRWSREHNIRQRPPSDQEIGHRLKKLSPSLRSTLARKAKGHVSVYRFSPVEAIRKEWDSFLGQAQEEGWQDGAARDALVASIF